MPWKPGCLPCPHLGSWQGCSGAGPFGVCAARPWACLHRGARSRRPSTATLSAPGHAARLRLRRPGARGGGGRTGRGGPAPRASPALWPHASGGAHVTARSQGSEDCRGVWRLSLALTWKRGAGPHRPQAPRLQALGGVLCPLPPVYRGAALRDPRRCPLSHVLCGFWGRCVVGGLCWERKHFKLAKPDASL